MRLLPIVLAAASLGIAPARAADPGERAFQYCISCHSVDPADAKISAPNLAHVIGRPVAAQKGFDYSPALKAFAKKTKRWTPELIDQLLADPQALIPGTRMELPPQLKKADVRAAAIGYLQQH